MVGERLEDLGYPPAVVRKATLIEKGHVGAFRALCTELVGELSTLDNLKEGSGKFPLSLQTFLTSQYFPDSSSLGMLERLESDGVYPSEANGMFCILDFLLSELQALRINTHFKESRNVIDTSDMMTDVSSDEGAASRSKSLRDLCDSLSVLIPESAGGTAVETVVINLKASIAALCEASPSICEQPLINRNNLSEAQCGVLRIVHDMMKQDYGVRKQMLLKRLDVTLQSMFWGDKGTDHEVALRAAVEKKIKSILGSGDTNKETPKAERCAS